MLFKLKCQSINRVLLIKNVLQSSVSSVTNMAWAKARRRGKSGFGEDINKKLNTLLHLLLLLHPREFHHAKHEGIIFKTSGEVLGE